MEVSISKLDAAKQQLETAILLYFCEKDPVSIHTLCCSAYEVIYVLNKKRNSPMKPDDLMLKDLDQHLTSKAEKKQFHDSINASWNFFKHAASDANAVHTFETKFTEVLLYDAVDKYSRLIGECPRVMALYYQWFHIQHSFEGMQDSVSEIFKRAKSTMPKDPSKFYAECWPFIKPFRYDV